MANVEHTAEKVADQFAEYREVRNTHERRMIWGMLTAIGSAVLAMVFQGITWMIGKVIPHG